MLWFFAKIKKFWEVKKGGVIYVYKARHTKTETQIQKGSTQTKIVCIEYKCRFLFLSIRATIYDYLLYNYVLIETLPYIAPKLP